MAGAASHRLHAALPARARGAHGSGTAWHVHGLGGAGRGWHGPARAAQPGPSGGSGDRAGMHGGADELVWRAHCWADGEGGAASGCRVTSTMPLMTLAGRHGGEGGRFAEGSCLITMSRRGRSLLLRPSLDMCAVGRMD